MSAQLDIIPIDNPVSGAAWDRFIATCANSDSGCAYICSPEERARRGDLAIITELSLRHWQEHRCWCIDHLILSLTPHTPESAASPGGR